MHPPVLPNLRELNLTLNLTLSLTRARCRSSLLKQTVCLGTGKPKGRFPSLDHHLQFFQVRAPHATSHGDSGARPPHTTSISNNGETHHVQKSDNEGNVPRQGRYWGFVQPATRCVKRAKLGRAVDVYAWAKRLQPNLATGKNDSFHFYLSRDFIS